MLEQIKNELLKLGNKSEIIPITFFDYVRQDAAALKKSGFLNKFQNDLVNNVYDFNLPDLDFEIRSIILVASPSPSTIVVKFNLDGKKIPLRIPSTYTDYITAPYSIEQYLSGYLEQYGYHVKFDYRLSRKWLAVRSGLGIYGRNNICYVDGMGSFVNITSYYSDIPCCEGELHELRQMDECKTCRACLESCPTAAIKPDRFIIDNERCLTYFNEADGEQDFPEWIDASAHNSVVGCTRCQLNCPANSRYINEAAAAFEFSEAETATLVAGSVYEDLPEALANKIDTLNMKDYLNVLPRNLKVLFDRAGAIG